jgi:hypothetical protein
VQILFEERKKIATKSLTPQGNAQIKSKKNDQLLIAERFNLKNNNLFNHA